MAGALQMIAVAPPLILLLMAGAARPERRAARHCGGHVVDGAGQPTTGRPRRAHHPPRPQCHRRAGLSGPGQRAPVGLAGDLGARRVAEDRACAARSIRCAAAVRGSGPRLAPSVAWSAGLGGAAGPRGIVRARLLVRGGGCRRRCARGRRIRRPGAFPSPGWCWARATSGTTWKATSGRFAMCCRACSS